MKRAILLSFSLALAACSGAEASTPDAAATSPDAAAAAPDAVGPKLGSLVVNEVAAAGNPNDWFEIVNNTADTVTLSDFEFIDSNPIAMAAKFPDGATLAPGGYYVQEVTDAGNGFKLGSDEELWVYRVSDQMLSDGVDWAEGASPAGGSYARIPDVTGDFQTVTPDTRGVANQ